MKYSKDAEHREPAAAGRGPGMARRAKRFPAVLGKGPARDTKSVESDPSLLTGGLITSNRGLQAINADTVFGCSVDWLTATMGKDTASSLCDCTKVEEAGAVRPGFKRSQLRTYFAGPVWRRWEPRQASKAHGLDYESWEWSGDSAPWGAKYLRKHNVKPTRVDVCFNLGVASTLTADDVLEACRHHFEKQGLTAGISGQAEINTRYIGSKESQRRIKIYRKDKQDRSWAHLYGPTIRIEITLKNEHARLWWKTWAEDEQKGYRVAAAHIESMSGYELMEEEDVPELVKVDQASPAARLARFIEQNGATILAYVDAEIDVLALARQKVDASSSVCRSRMKAKRVAITNAGATQVQSLASDLLRSGH